MRNLIALAVLVFGGQAFALELVCNKNEFTIDVKAKKIVMSNYGKLSRDTQDQDCGYRSTRFACYEDGGQIMVNIPPALANGTVKSGVVYVQTDTDDNTDGHNHALLGVPYVCETK